MKVSGKFINATFVLKFDESDSNYFSPRIKVFRFLFMRQLNILVYNDNILLHLLFVDYWPISLRNITSTFCLIF